MSNKTNTLHLYTYKMRDALSRLGYKRPHVLRFKGTTDTVRTNGVTVWMPATFHGIQLDAPKPTKKAKRVAHSMVHTGALQLVYRASKTLRDTVVATQADSRLVNLALRIHAENMKKRFWPQKFNRKMDAYAKKIERKATLGKLLKALEQARKVGNQREINYLIIAICHISSAFSPFSIRKDVRKKDGTVIQVIATADEMKMVKQFARLRGTKIKIDNLSQFVSAIPMITGYANSNSRSLVSMAQAAQLGDVPDDLAAYAEERGMDPDYELDDFRSSVIAYEESRDATAYENHGAGYGRDINETDNEDDTVTLNVGEADTIQLEDLGSTLLDRIVDDCLTMQYKTVYQKKRGKTLPTAALLAQKITVQLKNTAQVEQVQGVVDQIDIVKAATAPISEDTFYMERVTNKPGHKRSVVLAVDISGSMAGSYITLAMTAAQAIALSVRNTGGYCGGVLFNALGYADPDLSDAPLFRENPFGVTGNTSFQFLSEVWNRQPHSIVVVITDGYGDLPYSISEEDRSRTYFIALNRGMVAQLEQMGKVHDLTNLAELPKVITDLII